MVDDLMRRGNARSTARSKFNADDASEDGESVVADGSPEAVGVVVSGDDGGGTVGGDTPRVLARASSAPSASAVAVTMPASAAPRPGVTQSGSTDVGYEPTGAGVTVSAAAHVGPAASGPWRPGTGGPRPRPSRDAVSDS